MLERKDEETRGEKRWRKRCFHGDREGVREEGKATMKRDGLCLGWGWGDE